jgi:general stress protein 26
MTGDRRSTGEARVELFERLADTRVGMLGVDGAGRMRPMTHFVDEEAGVIRFITSRTTELASEVGQGAMGHYCLVGDGFHAWISGTISPSDDAAKLDELWNPVAAAWFTGRDDPDILLLTMPMREAELWSSTDSTLHFGIEIARANLDRDREPDVGTHDKIRF